MITRPTAENNCVLGQFDVLHRSTRHAQLCCGAVKSRDHLGCRRRRGGEEGTRNSDAQTSHSLFDIGTIVGNWSVGAGRILRIVAGEHLQRDCRIFHAAGQRADVVKRPRQRKHATARDATIGWLDADRAAPCGRSTDRAAGVGAHCHAHHARADRGARAGRRTSGDVLGVPRIARRRKWQIEAGPPMANSCVASLPSNTPPASRSRAAATLSSFGTTFRRSFEWQVVRIPAVS